MNGDGNAYRAGLSMDELINVVRLLLAQQRTADRLVCRYLADLADKIGTGGFGDGWSDVYQAARCLFGLSTRATRERVRIGKALRELPKIEETFLAGEIGYSQVRELTRVARPEDEAEWVKLARELPIQTLERRVHEARGDEAVKEETDEPARVRWSSPEMVSVQMSLRAETWALLQRAMEGARRAATEDPGLLRQDDALAAVAKDALANQRSGESAEVHKTVVLYECRTCQRAEIETGAGAVELSPAAAAAFGCGGRVRDLKTFGNIVKRGGKMPRSVKTAIQLRDRGRCRVPGCHQRRYVDGHHLKPQAKGGEHSTRNCLCLCDEHHTKLHAGKLSIRGDANGELEFRDEEGRLIVDRSPGATQAGSRLGAIDENEARMLGVMGKRGGWHVDYLCDATGMDATVVLAAVTGLEMMGLVRQETPGMYRAV